MSDELGFFVGLVLTTSASYAVSSPTDTQKRTVAFSMTMYTLIYIVLSIN